MGRFEIEQVSPTKTVIRKRHPFFNFLVILLGISMIVEGFEKAPWLLIPLVAGIVWLVVMAVKGQRAKKSRAA